MESPHNTACKGLCVHVCVYIYIYTHIKVEHCQTLCVVHVHVYLQVKMSF